jgi:nucleotide-binding universal stress UspA family protein
MHVVVGPVFAMGRHTEPTPLQVDSVSAETRRFEALARLEGIAERLRERNLRVATRVTLGIDAAWALQDAFRSSRFDVLAMTTHGAGGLRRLWMGSVADKVVRGATKPVLVLRPPKHQ